MKLELKKFGELLTSRPAGKEAYLSAKAYTLPKDTKATIEVDFSGVKVLSPSWADEFLTPLQRDFPAVTMVNTANPSVKATLDILARFSHPRP